MEKEARDAVDVRSTSILKRERTSDDYDDNVVKIVYVCWSFICRCGDLSTQHYTEIQQKCLECLYMYVLRSVLRIDVYTN